MLWLTTIITGIVFAAIIYGLRPARETRANFSLFILLGVMGAVIGEWFFAYVLGISFGRLVAGFRWDAIIWGIIGAAITLAIYESFLIQPVSRVQDEEITYREAPRTSQPTAHEYRERQTKSTKEKSHPDDER